MENKRLSQREALEAWRLKKGLSKKENCHPLCSRKRSLSKVVSSPSFKPPKVKKQPIRSKLSVNNENIVLPKKERKIDTIKPKQKAVNHKKIIKRRQTISVADLKSFKQSDITPWNDKTLPMQERLNLWRERRGKKPLQRLPIWQNEIPKSQPFSKLKYTSVTPMSHRRRSTQLREDTQDVHISSSSEKDNTRSNNDVNDVIEDRLSLVQDSIKKNRMSKYVITPGRRVHFAMLNSPSPTYASQSSAVKYCILDSKLNKRVRFDCDSKVMTPVRRSIRLSTSAIPDFLRDSENRIVQSPHNFESEIVEGGVVFRPNQHLNTPLNNGWLIQDLETHDEDDDANVSFM